MTKQKQVVGIETNKIFNVKKGKVCTQLKRYFYNGEGWLKLQPTDGGPVFDSPEVFWEVK
jgi:hypothetical protein